MGKCRGYCAPGVAGAVRSAGCVAGAVWAVFALVLALVDWRFKLDELRWQVHALAALTLWQSVTVNL